MQYLDNSVLELDCNNPQEIFQQIHDHLIVMPEMGETSIIKLNSIIKNSGKTYAIFEQDLSRILVQFKLHNEIFVFDKIKEPNEPNAETHQIMSIEEVQLLKTLGKIILDDETYKITSISYVLGIPDNREIVIELTEINTKN